uniref:Uncharacterized protein n=1 Tax=Acrobeloides nanus TaxID=290746 RepID=A0A914DSC0_9BILA
MLIRSQADQWIGSAPSRSFSLSPFLYVRSPEKPAFLLVQVRQFDNHSSLEMKNAWLILAHSVFKQASLFIATMSWIALICLLFLSPANKFKKDYIMQNDLRLLLENHQEKHDKEKCKQKFGLFETLLIWKNVITLSVVLSASNLSQLPFGYQIVLLIFAGALWHIWELYGNDLTRNEGLIRSNEKSQQYIEELKNETDKIHDQGKELIYPVKMALKGEAGDVTVADSGLGAVMKTRLTEEGNCINERSAQSPTDQDTKSSTFTNPRGICPSLPSGQPNTQAGVDYNQHSSNPEVPNDNLGNNESLIEPFNSENNQQPSYTNLEVSSRSAMPSTSSYPTIATSYMTNPEFDSFNPSHYTEGAQCNTSITEGATEYYQMSCEEEGMHDAQGYQQFYEQGICTTQVHFTSVAPYSNFQVYSQSNNAIPMPPQEVLIEPSSEIPSSSLNVDQSTLPSNSNNLAVHDPTIDKSNMAIPNSSQQSVTNQPRKRGRPRQDENVQPIDQTLDDAEQAKKAKNREFQRIDIGIRNELLNLLKDCIMNFDIPTVDQLAKARGFQIERSAGDVTIQVQQTLMDKIKNEEIAKTLRYTKQQDS